ncbi:MAG: lysylphosphatidylglycerol synthase transmembrane domain-containing protein [Caldilinea sp.]|uniref:lysylphosphatidylglycerol synthase transmembrane domain-containing protein n=1 Tax=Caldilinea sp. TaxID=2293560 RepID=UPI0030B0A824
MTRALRKRARQWFQPGRLAVQLIWLALAIALLWLTLRAVDLREVWERLRRLEPEQIGLLLLINLAVLATFSLRWWLLLLAQGYRISYALLIGYRLATFAVSYFTPGPHFGGEPLQVYLVSSRHGVPLSASVAAVVVDKTLEMTTNFTFLTLGALFLVQAHPMLGIGQTQLLFTTVALLLAPLSLLIALLAGGRPLSALLKVFDRMGQRWSAYRGSAFRPFTETRWARAIYNSEAQSVALCRNHPGFLLLAVGASLLSWGAIIGEFWLMTAVLGMRLTIAEAITALLAARIAILLPMPAAIGALEASQALAMRMLGQSSAAGVSLSLLIRARDVLFGVAGLGLAGALLARSQKSAPSTDESGAVLPELLDLSSGSTPPER